MKNNKIMIGVSGLILFLVYNIIVFTFSTERTQVFWSAYLFTVLAFLVQAVVFAMVYKRNVTVNDVFFSLPLVKISVKYLVLQVALGAIFMILENISVRIVNIAQIIVLAVYLMLAIAALVAKNNIESIEEKTKERILFIKLLENDIVALQDRVNNPAIQTRLADLREIIKYSDPMSHPSLALLEQKVSNKIAQLSEASNNEMFDEIEALMADRNRKCKILKK